VEIASTESENDADLRCTHIVASRTGESNARFNLRDAYTRLGALEENFI